jgi:alkylation response protein AidB-like acyl-CoA dehydrogenase
MRFALDEDAAALREAAAQVLRGEVTADVIRAGWPGGDRDAVAAVWRKLGDVGVAGTLVAAGDGGLGLDENALVPLLEEIGYSGLPVPAVETIAVAAPLLAAARSVATIFTASLDRGGIVPFGQVADLFVLRDGDSLRLYQRGELELEPVSSVDGSRALARLRRRRAGGAPLGGDPEAAWNRGVLGTAALLTGLARRMLDMTVEYVKHREQFGVPVGSFQAVGHALADALVAVEFARPFVLAAAWAQAAGEADAATLTSGAKIRANEAARRVARTAIQCHGAMGYTTEYDLHLFAKRAWVLAPSWGDTNWHRTRIARAIGVADE